MIHGTEIMHVAAKRLESKLKLVKDSLFELVMHCGECGITECNSNTCIISVDTKTMTKELDRLGSWVIEQEVPCLYATDEIPF